MGRTKKNGGVNTQNTVAELGTGAFGSAKVVEQNGKKYVIKTISKETTNKYDIHREYKNQVKAFKSGCGIVPQPHGLTEDGENYYIKMAYLEGYITLKDWVLLDFKKGPSKLKTLSSNLLIALNCLHSHNLVHRDIKPENVMVNPESLQVVFIDWGLSCFNEDCIVLSLAGSWVYTHPDILARITEDNVGWSIKGLTQDKYKKYDRWSLGMTILELIYDGVHPFEPDYTHLAALHSFYNSRLIKHCSQKLLKQWGELIQTMCGTHLLEL
jgi:serine/threonine protein kinase